MYLLLIERLERIIIPLDLTKVGSACSIYLYIPLLTRMLPPSTTATNHYSGEVVLTTWYAACSDYGQLYYTVQLLANQPLPCICPSLCDMCRATALHGHGIATEYMLHVALPHRRLAAVL